MNDCAWHGSISRYRSFQAHNPVHSGLPRGPQRFRHHKTLCPSPIRNGLSRDGEGPRCREWAYSLSILAHFRILKQRRELRQLITGTRVEVVRPSGFEPLAFCSGGKRSIQAELRARNQRLTNKAGNLDLYQRRTSLHTEQFITLGTHLKGVSPATPARTALLTNCPEPRYATSSSTQPGRLEGWLPSNTMRRVLGNGMPV